MHKERIGVVTDAVRLATRMRDLGVSRTGYAKILREAIFFTWELAEGPKHGDHRPRSAAARGLKPSELDYDHAVPVRIVIDEMLEAGPDPDAVERILRTRVRAVLLTKPEHERLRSCGLSSRMPDDWDGVDWRARYVAAGIEVPGHPEP